LTALKEFSGKDIHELMLTALLNDRLLTQRQVLVSA
jgi:hypothetical protein